MSLILNNLYAFFSGIFGKYVTDVMLRFVAVKALAITMITVTFPMVIKNLVTWLFETVASVAASSIDITGMNSVVVSLTGYAGYLGSHLLLVDCLAVILTGLAIRLVLNFIPFVG